MRTESHLVRDARAWIDTLVASLREQPALIATLCDSLSLVVNHAKPLANNAAYAWSIRALAQQQMLVAVPWLRKARIAAESLKYPTAKDAETHSTARLYDLASFTLIVATGSSTAQFRELLARAGEEDVPHTLPHSGATWGDDSVRFVREMIARLSGPGTVFAPLPDSLSTVRTGLALALISQRHAQHLRAKQALFDRIYTHIALDNDELQLLKSGLSIPKNKAYPAAATQASASDQPLRLSRPKG